MTARTLRKHFPELSPEAARLLADMTDDRSHEGIDCALDTASDMLNGYGVEAIHDDEWTNYYLSIGLLYVNMGDPYYHTLMYDTRTGRYVAGCWGDYIDSSAERRRRFADR